VITEVSPVASVTLDGSGSGQVSVGPPSGATWRLALAAVSTTGTVRQPQAFLYRGSTSGPLTQIDSTFLGNSASSGKVAAAAFYSGQVLWAKWTGGDPGAVATLQAYGQQGGRGELPFDGTAGEGFPLNVATVFQAGSTVIASSGLFTYNGDPGPGNTPIFAVVAPGTTADPFGNPVQTLANIGNLTASHVGFDTSGVEYLSDAGGTTRIMLDPQNRVVSFYDASGVGANAALITIASAAGADRFTADPFPAGIDLAGLPLTAGATTISNLGVQLGGVVQVLGGTLEIGNGSTANIALNPAMGVPANYPTAGKTLAQTQACVDQLVGELVNRGMVS
jgi:hypothetical protein